MGTIRVPHPEWTIPEQSWDSVENSIREVYRQGVKSGQDWIKL
jgi:hypothetical protein